MTMICEAKNKAELKAKLERGVRLEDPKPWGSEYFDSNSVACPVGFKGVVVLDPQTRRRFAQIERTAKGWKVT